MMSVTLKGLAGCALVVAAIGVGGAACGSRSASEGAESSATASEDLADEAEAVAIARRAIDGVVEIQETSSLVVDVKNDVIVVEWRTNLPPRTRGPDYDARVTVDRRSREVIELLVGS